MDKKIIAVVGATGLQGKGVVNALNKNGSFKVRAITRNPDKYQGKANEVVKGDLTNLESLTNAFKNAHDVFVVTNWGEGAGEIAQMLAYFEAHTYMGPGAEPHFELAKEIATGELTTINTWIKQNVN